MFFRSLLKINLYEIFLHSASLSSLEIFSVGCSEFFALSRISRLWLPARSRLILFSPHSRLCAAHKNQSSTGTFYCRQFHVKRKNAYINFPRESHQTEEGKVFNFSEQFLMASHIVADMWAHVKKIIFNFDVFAKNSKFWKVIFDWNFKLWKNSKKNKIYFWKIRTNLKIGSNFSNFLKRFLNFENFLWRIQNCDSCLKSWTLKI